MEIRNQWCPHRDCLAYCWAVTLENSPKLAKQREAAVKQSHRPEGVACPRCHAEGKNRVQLHLVPTVAAIEGGLASFSPVTGVGCKQEPVVGQVSNVR